MAKRRKPIVIRTPYPTAESTAREYGLSRAAVREVLALAEAITKKPRRLSKPRNTSKPIRPKRHAG